jgi:hypothetical protein
MRTLLGLSMIGSVLLAYQPERRPDPPAESRINTPQRTPQRESSKPESPEPVERGQATPPIRLVVPDSPVSYGDMIIVQAVVDKASMPKEVVDYKHQWLVLENGRQKPVLVWPDGTQAFFAAGMQPRQFTVILDTDYLFEKIEGGVIKSAWIQPTDATIAVITVGSGPAPTPTPNPPGPTPNPPTPTPTPDPVLPDGQFGLARFVFSTLKNDANIAAGDKPKLAAALGTSFDKIAAQIAALSTFKDVEKDILPSLKTSNSAALAASGVPVASTLAFKSALNDKLYSLYHDKPAKLVTADDFGTAFREIAQGLAAFK